MGERPDQIERHIDDERSRLGANVNELENKVKNAFDWRVQFQQRPMTLMGVAFGLGVMAAAMTGGNRYRNRSRYSAGNRLVSSSSSESGNMYGRQKMGQTWNNIKGALMGVASTKLKDFLGDAVPGFHEHYRNAESRSTDSGRQKFGGSAFSSDVERTGTTG